jgi:hypothetical protein
VHLVIFASTIYLELPFSFNTTRSAASKLELPLQKSYVCVHSTAPSNHWHSTRKMKLNSRSIVSSALLVLSKRTQIDRVPHQLTETSIQCLSPGYECLSCNQCLLQAQHTSEHCILRKWGYLFPNLSPKHLRVGCAWPRQRHGRREHVCGVHVFGCI